MYRTLPLLFGLTFAACVLAPPSPVSLDVHVGGLAQVDIRDGETRYTYTWPGVYFEARFSGPVLIVDIDDEHNKLHLIVDGETRHVLKREGRRTITLDDLGDGEHTVRLEKITETQGPTGTFLGFRVPSREAALSPPSYARAIEFIGDSYTVGYGNESPGVECTDQELWELTNTSLAFGSLTAKHFHADYRILASSGLGVVRNYANEVTGTNLPRMAEEALQGNTQPFSPDVVVVALGTNDFSTPVGPDEAWADAEELRRDYHDSYVAFVERLRARAPGAPIVLVGHELFIDELHAVHHELTRIGIDRVSLMHASSLDFLGCHYHPSAADHRVLARQLIGLLTKLDVFTADI